MACHAPTNNIAGTYRDFGKPVGHSLSIIVGAFKSSVTREINKMRGVPGSVVWQRDYFERIIRDKAELFILRKYISENPSHLNIKS